MEWTIRYHRKAKKFLRRLEDDKRNLLLNKLNELKICLEEGIFPVRRFDLKKLKGKWIGFFRLRVGDLRIILRIDIPQKTIFVYHIHFRGAIY